MKYLIDKFFLQSNIYTCVCLGWPAALCRLSSWSRSCLPSPNRSHSNLLGTSLAKKCERSFHPYSMTDKKSRQEIFFIKINFFLTTLATKHTKILLCSYKNVKNNAKTFAFQIIFYGFNLIKMRFNKKIKKKKNFFFIFEGKNSLFLLNQPSISTVFFLCLRFIYKSNSIIISRFAININKYEFEMTALTYSFYFLII